MPKILVIEDMPDSAEMVQQILANYGHEVLLAEDGETGLALAHEHKPDLIIFDFLLPDLDAATFLDRLRINEDAAQTPIIACSATHPHLIQQSVGQTAFSGFIQKPFRVSSFMEVVEEHLPPH